MFRTVRMVEIRVRVVEYPRRDERQGLDGGFPQEERIEGRSLQGRDAGAGFPQEGDKVGGRGQK